MDYFKNDLSSIHAGLLNKDFSSKELTTETFKQIKATDAKIEAFLTLDEKQALAAAQKVDERGITDADKLAGIPVGIKDNIVTKGLKTTAASKILGNFEPIYNATVMDKLEAARMIDVGKLNLDEFAMGGSTENSAFKITKNAWDQTKVPGGSSGGPAAAVASGQLLVALGTDTGGSIRQPAAFNGIVGVKPTYGRVSRYGVIAFGSSLDQVGPMTRTVKDNALMLSAISGHDKHDFTSSEREVPDFTAKLNGDIKKMRIGLPKEFMDKGVNEDVRAAIQNAAKTFEKLGAVVEEVSLPYSKYGVPVYYIIASSEASSNLQRYDGIRYGFRADDVKNLEDVYVRSRSEGFGDEVKRRIMLGTFSLSAGTYDAYFKKAAQVRTLICQDFANVFANYDLILAPTTTSTAFGIGEEINDPVTMYMNDILTIPVNLAGLPGMSLPAGFSNGLPIGMQLIAPQFGEETMYRAGYAFEQATDFHKEVPTIGGEN
ncbi:aspartyl glutamyl-tRNA amidotransferase subunit A [Ligilactobacillus acidipiscis DSM 15836]|uniref:Glutamyl-tRNA(Gln) amidotransferase subunit A n=2 Tax=Ligilactobacillus acidipiscis TaxID=89059 RepID=A0A0R2KDI3_9LACO|nr:Asp-tRNA(Asn)/Glu-tRNA(Gln) amidotransferase subunit GatA [Ligilactobacillus acidipiscis]KRM26532.1 aspartyl glutamyl-tRNA amidotransferase subunit A [Ligilactobacillus acidipiscis DSM 15836]KRN84599.1 aspartyl glutamyl-tRNA amidotransferase subunit A [Ligilactobacillus acidipiscis]SFV41101.1 Aspartyl-tRNA(Asn) amidotransferase subunit A @ Glutamyl-tRNA(Gln) amidotransferase subunit A [Ligilactobacillus acidipiscis]GAW64420.1 aspartyl/glutamyl-tRNA(Asn/Gln) amidotransferase subunit A [Ligila